MNLRKLLLLAFLFTLGQTNLFGQDGNTEKQNAYQAMKAAEKAFNSIDHGIKAMQARRVIPGQFNQGRNGVIVPVVPQNMFDLREEAWARFQQAAAAYAKFGGTVQNRMAPTEFLKWLEAQSVEINDPAVRAKLMEHIQGDNWEAARTLQFLMQQGTKANSYRDALLTYARSEALQQRSAIIRLQVVEAVVRVDPSTKAELSQITMNWFDRPSQQRDLLKALEGSKYTPNANKTSGKKTTGKQ